MPGANIYRVERTSTLEPATRTVGMGLTTAKFAEPAPERGESVTYTIFAVGRNGVSLGAEAVKITVPKPMSTRMQH